MRTTTILLLLALVLPGCGPRDDGGEGQGNGLRLDDVPAGRSLAVEADRKPWEHPAGVGEVVTTRHYRIFTSADNRTLTDVLPGFLEAAYEHYQELTHVQADKNGKPMDVYMLASRQQWVHLTRHVFGDRAPHLSIGAGGYCFRGIGVYWDMRQRGTLSIAAHEGMHQFLYHHMRHRLPTSIEEGLAVLAEGFHVREDDNTVAFLSRHNPSRYGTLRRALVNKRWVPAKKLLVMTGGDAIKGTTTDTLAWYSQVWALAMFLRTSEHYRKGFFRMLADGRDGLFHRTLGRPLNGFDKIRMRGGVHSRVVGLALFKHYITADFDTFERRYVAFSRKLARLPADQ